ncbi:MAG TPA: betaine--homocysteine S-methyltransferase [Usitatibacter sp.]|nr:betaine--homocysteine S-methyltransferase [Usitatibacter sp.]
MGDTLQRLLSEREVLLLDGAMGTNLFALGLANGAPGELWNVERPADVRTVYQGFVDAGSDIILTNSFGSNRFRFALHKLQGRVRELNMAAAALARDVADKAGRPVVVAGSMGPTGDVLEPLGPRTAAEAEEAFHEQAQALREGGADVAWIETMFAENELEAAVRGAQRAGLPIVATMTFDTGGRTMMGVKPADAMRLSKTLPARPIAFGANCGIGPSQLIDSVLGLAQGSEPGDVIIAKSNCGLPVMGDDMRVRYDGTPEVMATYARFARDAGARIIGGCCGTTATHVRAMAQALAGGRKGAAPTYEEIERKLGPIRKNTTRAQEKRAARQA